MPWEQRLDHPANDLARELLQVTLAGTGVRLSDGSSNVVPASDRTEDVHAAWRLHAEHVRHSLSAGFYQGWDLHPAHFVSRYAAVYGWLLPHLVGCEWRVWCLACDRSAEPLARGRSSSRRAGNHRKPASLSPVGRRLGCGRRQRGVAASGLTHDELFGSG